MDNINRKINNREATANRFRQLRNEMGLTQEEFAEKLGLSVNSIKKMEKGEYNISISNLRKLRNEFEVSSDYLLFGEMKTVDDIWFLLQNTDDNEKLKVLMRLVRYFGGMNNNIYADRMKNEEIFSVIERLLDEK